MPCWELGQARHWVGHSVSTSDKPVLSRLTKHSLSRVMDGEQTPPTVRKRPRRQATVAGQDRQAHEEAKYAMLERACAEEELGDPLPDSDAGSDAEVECSAGMLEMQLVRIGPYMDEAGRRVYLCDVGMMDDDGHWHDGVPWEVPSTCIQRHELASFHCVTKEEVGDIPLIPDWSRPSAQERLDAGVPAHDVFGSGKRTGMRKRASGDLKGLYYTPATGGSAAVLSSFYQGVGTADEGAEILGVIMSSHQALGKGVIVELMQPPKTLFFVRKVNVQCTDGILDGGETDLEGFFCHVVADLLACPFDRQSEFDEYLEWERLACKSVVAVGRPAVILAAEVKCCLNALPPPFWEDALADLDGFIQICGWSEVDPVGEAGEKRKDLHVCAISHAPTSLYGYACLQFGQSRTILEMVKTTVVNCTLTYLRNMTKRGTADDIRRLSVAIDNVPPTFMFWALGRRWFLHRPPRVFYNPVAYMHTFAGDTRDFTAFFGRDLRGIMDRQVQPAAHINDPRVRVGISVEAGAPDANGRHIPSIRFKYSMKRPGKLLIQFAAIRKWGPYRNDPPTDLPENPIDRERMLRVVMWDTGRQCAGIHAQPALEVEQGG